MDGNQNFKKSSTQMRIVLQRYEQQLLTARRLAKFRARTCAREGLDVREPDPAEKRREYVVGVANELMNSLLFTGVSPEMMEEIRLELCKALGKEFVFVFPPDSNLCIYVIENGQRRPLSEVEQRQAALLLRHITENKVNSTMMNRPQRAGLYC